MSDKGRWTYEEARNIVSGKAPDGSALPPDADLEAIEADAAWDAAEREAQKSGPANMSDDPQTLELDCPPGSPRPGDLYPGVIEGTGLPTRTPVLKFFGNWTWDYSDIAREKWLAVQPTLKERITKLYESGAIRYGSW